MASIMIEKHRCIGCGNLFMPKIICRKCKRIDYQFCLSCHNHNDSKIPKYLTSFLVLITGYEFLINGVLLI